MLDLCGYFDDDRFIGIIRLERDGYSLTSRRPTMRFTGCWQRYGFDVPSDISIRQFAAHGRGEWAGANAQLRTFVEGLFDEMAQRLSAHLHLPPPENGDTRFCQSAVLGEENND